MMHNTFGIKFRDAFPQECFDDPTIEDARNFRYMYLHCGLPTKIPTDTDIDWLKTIFVLLLGRFGESDIAYDSLAKFRLETMRIIFQYAPLWIKELTVQDEIRALDIEDLLKGNKIINGHMYNPSTINSAEGIMDDGNVPLNEANITLYKKSIADAYALLETLLDNDPTERFLAKFKPLFAKVIDMRPAVYWNHIGGEDCDEEQ